MPDFFEFIALEKEEKISRHVQLFFYLFSGDGKAFAEF